MTEVIIGHPYRDNHDGGILIPTKVSMGHAGKTVSYKTPSGDMVGIMPLDTWEQYCSLIKFETEEGA